MMIEQLFMFLVLFVSICKYDSPYFMFFGMWIDFFFKVDMLLGKTQLAPGARLWSPITPACAQADTWTWWFEIAICQNHDIVQFFGV